MIKRFDGFKEEAVTPSKQLPAGSYVIEIKGVKFIQGEGNKSDRIEMAIDIAEGEQAGFYKEQFDASTDEDKKWKGKATIWMPDGSNSDADKRAVRNFNSFAAFLANENAGYHWDWDESKWKGLLVGMIFKDHPEWKKEADIKEGDTDLLWHKAYTYRPTTVACVRSGDYKIPEPAEPKGVKPQIGATIPGVNAFVDVVADDNDELPFK